MSDANADQPQRRQQTVNPVDGLKMIAEASVKSACVQAASTLVTSRAEPGASPDQLADEVATLAFELYDGVVKQARGRAVAAQSGSDD
ncbi:MAG: hypothetical protein NXI16_14300 [Alphaproteobacteria bacterium]|nr:hypothetical protein [Alphaproteobacteria bacterium]